MREALDPPLEAPRVRRLEPNADVRDGFVLLDPLDQEEPRGASVEPLRHRPHASRAHDPHQPGLLEHLQVVAHRALGEPELLGQGGGRGGAFAQQRDDALAALAGESAELIGLGDDEDVNGFVVRYW